MTSRETLALGRRRGARCSPRCSSPLAPRRARERAVAVAGAVAGRRRSRSRWRRVALGDPDDPSVGDWLVVDAAGGLLVGVDRRSSGSRASSSRPRTSRTRRDVARPPERRDARTTSSSTRSGRSCSPCRSPATSAPRGCSSRRRRPPSALLVGFSGKAARARGGLEVPDPHLARARRRAARDRAPRGRHARRRARRALLAARCRRTTPGARPALVAYLLLLAGLAAKIGWAPVHNWLPDAHSEAPPPVSALLSAALLPAVLLVAWRSRAGARARSSGARTAQSVLIALRARLARRRGPVPLAPARLEAAARLLEPRAHGRDRARDRLRDAARARRRRRPHRRPRDREGARLLRGHAAARPRAARGRARRHRHRPHAARARHDDGHLARRARRPAALAALRRARC